MLPKSLPRATLWLALLSCTACGSTLPWREEPPAGAEVNLSFTVRNNLLMLPSATIDGHRGRYFFGSATPRTVLDPNTVHALGATRNVYTFTAGDRQTMTFSPVIADLGRAGDALIGADIVGRQSVMIDYRAGLLTLQTRPAEAEFAVQYRFSGEPAVDVIVDGKTMSAIVDTSSPDTLILPGRPARGRAVISLGGVNLGSVDVAYANVARPRIGNRLLSLFLVGIDYGRGVVALWRDPRTKSVLKDER